MKIWKHLEPDLIFLDVSVADKESALRFITESFLQKGIVENFTTLLKGIKNRESLMSTGIGGGIGIPHTTCSEAKDESILLARLDKPIDFNSLDSLKVDIIVAIVVPENKTALHLQILAGISRLCMEPEFFTAVRNAADSKKLIEAIRTIEENIAFH